MADIVFGYAQTRRPRHHLRFSRWWRFRNPNYCQIPLFFQPDFTVIQFIQIYIERILEVVDVKLMNHVDLMMKLKEKDIATAKVVRGYSP